MDDLDADGEQYKTTEEIEQGIIQNPRASGNQRSIYMRCLFWSVIEDSGFPDRVNQAVATHRQVDIVCMQDV